jgi:hypothetical protein
MHKEGRRIIIESARPKSLLKLLSSLKPIKERFPKIKDIPPEPVEI